jgi:cell division protein FtsQ
MRKTYEYGSTGSAVLDAAEKDSARPGKAGKIRRAMSDPLRPPRELADSYANDEDTEAFLRASGRARRIRRGIIPRTKVGRIAAGVSVAIALGGIAFGYMAVLKFLTTNETFRIPSSASIEIDGNNHLTRSQMLSVFGEDVERNIFKVPMNQRRAELEAMPWVEHATVMRLLPNRIRVHITERVPVAFVRQGGSIGMVDSSGVLLDIPPDAPGNPNYSFPVVTGLKASDAVEERGRRMKLYTAFIHDMDSDGKGTSTQLSEVDLSDVEDVKALVPDHSNEVLVHFGTENFLTRYKKFEDHIAEWRQQYPHLSSVDMRYERQVVLQMPPKDSTVVGGQSASTDEAKTDAPTGAGLKTVEKKVSAADKRTVALVAKPKPVVVAKSPSADIKSSTTVAKPVSHPVDETVRKSPPVKHPDQAKPVGKQTAKDAATQKRVEAIRAWMAKRHDAQQKAAN